MVAIIVLFVVGGMIYGMLAGLWEEEKPSTQTTDAGERNYYRVEVDDAMRQYHHAIDAIDELPLTEDEKEHHRRQAKRRLQKTVRWVMTGGSED